MKGYTTLLKDVPEIERLVKPTRNMSRIGEMRARLKAALKEVKEAQRLASMTAACCEVSIDDLSSDIQMQIGTLENHLKDGILEYDVIVRKKA